MPEELRVARGEVSVSVNYSRPAFSLFANPSELSRHLFEHLEPHGLKLSGMRLEAMGESLATPHLSCFLGGSATVRVWPERLDVVADATLLAGTAYRSLLIEALEAVPSYAGEVAYSALTFNVSVHGTLNSVSPQELLQRFTVSTPPSLGPLLGAGALFYYGAETEQSTASLYIDLSSVVAEGLFVQTTLVASVSNRKATEIAEIVDARISRALRSLDLTWTLKGW